MEMKKVDSCIKTEITIGKDEAEREYIGSNKKRIWNRIQKLFHYPYTGADYLKAGNSLFLF